MAINDENTARKIDELAKAFQFSNEQYEDQEDLDIDDLRKIRIEKQRAETRDLIQEYNPRIKDDQFRNLMKSFPKKSLFLVGESGSGKSSLIEFWTKLFKLYGKSSFYLTEKVLMDDYFFNDYGNDKTDTNKILNLFRFEYVFFDEFFNVKNWDRKNAFHTVGDLIEMTYENIKKNPRTKVIFASNHKIEKFVSEKSIIRKFYDIVN